MRAALHAVHVMGAGQARHPEELAREPRQLTLTFTASIAVFVVDTTLHSGADGIAMNRFLQVSTDVRGSYTAETLVRPYW